MLHTLYNFDEIPILNYYDYRIKKNNKITKVGSIAQIVLYQEVITIIGDCAVLAQISNQLRTVISIFFFCLFSCSNLAMVQHKCNTLKYRMHKLLHIFRCHFISMILVQDNIVFLGQFRLFSRESFKTNNLDHRCIIYGLHSILFGGMVDTTKTQ